MNWLLKYSTTVDEIVLKRVISLTRFFRYYVNRDTLFSYHKASEVFLQRLMALYVASHYKVFYYIERLERERDPK